MTAGYPIEIDGLEFEPVPENWIEVGADHVEPDGPQLLAVSVALLRNNTLKVRYAHPEHDSVGAMWFPTLEDRTLPDDSAVEPWRRSVGAARLEPVGTIRAPEREQLLELWGDRVDDVLEEPERFSAKRPIADGGLAPECRVSGCHATAERSRDHPDFGVVDVCPTCAKLFEEGDA